MIKHLKYYIFIIFAIVFTVKHNDLSAQKRIKLPQILNENSGLIFISKDTCLWINDSNNPSEIIQSDCNGKKIIIYNLNLKNYDWEDLTIDDSANIYIADLGNNALVRNYHTVYKLNKNFTFQDSFVFEYMIPPNEKDNKFDAESIVWINGKLHIFTKGITKNKYFRSHHYILNPSLHNSVAKYIESIDLKGYVFTGAALSPDMSTIAICAYRYEYIFGVLPDTDSKIFFYEVPSNGDSIFSKSKGSMTVPTWFITRQYESIDYLDERHIILGSEKTLFLKPLLRKIKISQKLK